MALDDNDKRWILDTLRQELRQEIHDSETRILTAFHQWASPVEARMRSHSAAIRALDIETESLAERLKALEKPGLP